MKTNPDIATTIPSEIIKILPVFICLNLSRNSFTIISAPPVVAPALKISPIETPTRTAPVIEARSKSSVTGPYGARRFIANDEMIRAYIDETKSLKPSFNTAMTMMGIFIISTKVPVGKSVILFIIIAIPVTPPGASLLGSRKRLIPTA